MLNWDLDPLFDLRHLLEELYLIRIDANRREAPGCHGTSRGRINSLITLCPLLGRRRVIIH